MAGLADFSAAAGLTVGNVASIIFFLVFLSTTVKLLCPHAIVFALSGFVGDSNTAATWTVAGRLLQNTYWPELLRTDSAMRHNVSKATTFVSYLLPFTSLLIVLTGIVTPLGLYEGLFEATPVVGHFQYAHDDSPFGLGTPWRSSLGFNRECGFKAPKPCPFSDTVMTYSSNETAESYSYSTGTYDLRIPQILLDTYSSGVQRTTVSSFFDIQWRQWATRSEPQSNNGSFYLVGSLRQIQSLVLAKDVRPIEGLIVDTVNGSIGFRNHTIPVNVEQSASWTEDLLFIEPETACVDTNLTMDFGIVSNGVVNDLALVDRGGFANINHTYPTWNRDHPETNADLQARAYKAAWMSNAWSMLYWNLTNPRNYSSGEPPFSYIDSYVGKRYPLRFDNKTAPTPLNSLQIDTTWQNYLGQGGSGLGLDGGGLTNNSVDWRRINPFHLDYGNFSDISLICTGGGGGDLANITNILVACGLLYGAAKRTNAGSPLIFEEGSKWSIPMYACATATKASVKIVTFNQTSSFQSLTSLSVTSVEQKNYSSLEDQPLWGVENSGFNNSEIQPLWGLVADDADAKVRMSTVRSPHLYLPGYNDGLADLAGFPTHDNLPGAHFFKSVGSRTYGIKFGGTSDVGIDYTGYTNLAMWSQWQQLSEKAEDASHILNLIWTDVASSYVVGTRSSLGPLNYTDPTAPSSGEAVPITIRPYVSRISFEWPYAIPAFLVALLFLVCAATAGIIACLGRSDLSGLRRHIHETSAGRIFTVLWPEQHQRGDTSPASTSPASFAMRAKQWSREHSAQTINPGKISTLKGISGEEKLSRQGGYESVTQVATEVDLKAHGASSSPQNISSG